MGRCQLLTLLEWSVTFLCTRGRSYFRKPQDWPGHSKLDHWFVTKMRKTSHNALHQSPLRTWLSFSHVFIGDWLWSQFLCVGVEAAPPGLTWQEAASLSGFGDVSPQTGSDCSLEPWSLSVFSAPPWFHYPVKKIKNEKGFCGVNLLTNWSIQHK